MEMTVTQAADVLHVSPARVRQLISAGTLPAKKIGSTWILREEDVLDRLSKAPEAGRPKAKATLRDSLAYRGQTADGCEELYARCKEVFTSASRFALIEAAHSPEEASFYMAVADFFLQQKQAELVARGVY